MRLDQSASMRLVIAGLIILCPQGLDAAQIICGGHNPEVLDARIEMLDRTRQHGGLREELDSLRLHVVRCTVGGVLDAVAAMATTSWPVDRPHPYALVKQGDGDWHNANELRGAPLVAGTRFYYPLMGNWSVTPAADAT